MNIRILSLLFYAFKNEQKWTTNKDAWLWLSNIACRYYFAMAFKQGIRCQIIGSSKKGEENWIKKIF